MDKDLVAVVKTYSLSRDKLPALLAKKTPKKVAGILTALLNLYFNDKNSSTLREYLLVALSGYIVSSEKIGYDGKKKVGSKIVSCEAKPKNVNTADAVKKKLSGGGNFTDYTWNRFRKDLKNNPQMLVGGFVDGQLIFIFEFAFRSAPFAARLETQLQRRFPRGDIESEYLRSASFGLKDYKDIPDLKTRVFVSRKALAGFRGNITKGLYQLLEVVAK